MKEHQQVKKFDNRMDDNTDECNKFLKELGTRVVEVKAIYNTILGGMEYVVIYWC